MDGKHLSISTPPSRRKRCGLPRLERSPPGQWLLENMPVDARWCLVHATHPRIPRCARSRRSARWRASGPTTEGTSATAFFAGRVPRGRRARGIGGDSHVSRDPAEELRLLEYFQRVTRRKRNVVTSEKSPSVGTTLWSEAAAGGAQALGRRMGDLARAWRADLVVLDAMEGAPLNALIFSGPRGLVRDVMVGGRWVVRNGHHPSADDANSKYSRVLKELLQ